MRRRTDRPYAWGTMHHGAQLHAPDVEPVTTTWWWCAWHGPERVSGHADTAADAVLAVEHFTGDLAGI